MVSDPKIIILILSKPKYPWVYTYISVITDQGTYTLVKLKLFLTWQNSYLQGMSRLILDMMDEKSSPKK